MASAMLPYDKVVIASGPYAYWRLDETAGTVAKDSSGHNRDGTYTGSVTLGGGALLPAVDGAYLVLGANNAYVDVSAANQFCAGAAWSIECWINVASYNNLPVGGYTNQRGCRLLGDVLYSTGGWQAGLEWGIQSVNGNTPSSYRYYDFSHAWTPAFIPPGVGVLQHVVLVRSATGFAAYLNGKLIVPVTTAVATPVIQAVLQIGSTGGSMGRMNGTIGEFAVYDKALTAQQVASHYAAGVSRFFGVLDRLDAHAAGAYSLRRLGSRYSGPCIKVRRDSDDVATDIRFTSSGDLDVAALLAFVGSANGFVVTWYDQTGQGAPLMQPNAAKQPAIVTAGAVNWLSQGPQPCVNTNGGISGANGQTMQTATEAPSLTFPQPFTRSSVIGVSSMTPQYGNPIVMNGGLYQYAELYESSATTLDMFVYDLAGGGGAGFTAVSGLGNQSFGPVMETFSQANSSCTFNGVTRTGSVGTGGSTMLVLAAAVGGSVRCAAMNYSEVIVFAQTLSAADQSFLTRDQKNYWGTP